MAKAIAKGLVRLYQLCCGPFVGHPCRFYPSCSNYSLESLEKHGFLKGSWLTVVRLCKCGPWHPGGHDPVP